MFGTNLNDTTLSAPPLCRRVHACCRCRRCDFTAPDSSALLDHFNSAHCHESPPLGSANVSALLATSLTPSLTLSANGCSAPSTLAIKEESKGDLRLLYSLAPPEGRLAEAVKSEGGEEREKGWVLGESRAPGERGGGAAGEQVHGLLWVPKERAGPDRGSGGRSPSLFTSPLSLSFVAGGHEAAQQKRGVASPGLLYLGDTKPYAGDTKLYTGGRASGGSAAPERGGEKQIQVPTQQFAGGGGAQDGKGVGAKEESQSLLRVGRFNYFLFLTSYISN